MGVIFPYFWFSDVFLLDCKTQKKNTAPSRPSQNTFQKPPKTLKKISKNPQNTVKNSQKTLQKFTKYHIRSKNPQENHKVISFRNNYKINVGIAM
jgi:hypothetical protein